MIHVAIGDYECAALTTAKRRMNVPIDGIRNANRSQVLGVRPSVRSKNQQHRNAEPKSSQHKMIFATKVGRET